MTGFPDTKPNRLAVENGNRIKETPARSNKIINFRAHNDIQHAKWSIRKGLFVQLNQLIFLRLIKFWQIRVAEEVHIFLTIFYDVL